MIDKGRTPHQEKAKAQAECAEFLNRIGYAKKERDGVNAVCPRCGARHTVIDHTEAGIADYSVHIATKNFNSPQATVVEAKAGGLVFPFSRVDDEQWLWLDKWEKRTGGTAWFWLMLGTATVASKNPFARVTYLVPLHTMVRLKQMIVDATGGSRSVLPMNDSVPRTMIVMRANNLFANTQLGHCKMDWITGYGWWPNAVHPFWMTYQIEYKVPHQEAQTA